MPKMKYVYFNKKYMCSKNNFKHWTTESILPPDCEEEKSRDLIAKVKLYEEYGETQGAQILTQLLEVRKQLQLRFPEKSSQYENDGYGYAFEVFAISTLHQMTYQQAMACIVHGTDDGKVDAVVPMEKGPFLVYQIKMADLHNPNDMRLAEAHVNEFLRTGTISDPHCVDLIEHLKTHYSEIKDRRMDVRSICANDTGEKNVAPRDIFKRYFENILLPRTHSNLELRFPIKSNKITLPDGSTDEILNYACQPDSSSEAASILIFTSAEIIVAELLAQGVTSEDDRLYQDNVRGKLGVNVSMRQTIEKEPEKYVLYNNGLSVIGEYNRSQNEFIVYNPSFINGQQTLYNLIAAQKEGKDISQITVPVFIKKAATTQERQNIAFYNNAQRPIKDIDLLSLNSELRAIQKHLFDKAFQNGFKGDSYFLKLVSSGKREGDTIVPKLFPKENIIPLSEFVRMYWIIDKKSQLGDWKNNIGVMIRTEIIDKPYKFSVEKSERICKLIVQFNDYLSNLSKEKRQEYRNADVAFMYLINSFGGDIGKAQKVIDCIYTKFFVPKQRELPSAKLIDLYKSNTIFEQIREAKKSLGF